MRRVGLRLFGLEWTSRVRFFGLPLADRYKYVMPYGFMELIRRALDGTLGKEKKVLSFADRVRQRSVCDLKAYRTMQDSVDILWNNINRRKVLDKSLLRKVLGPQEEGKSRKTRMLEYLGSLDNNKSVSRDQSGLFKLKSLSESSLEVIRDKYGAGKVVVGKCILPIRLGGRLDSRFVKSGGGGVELVSVLKDSKVMEERGCIGSACRRFIVEEGGIRELVWRRRRIELGKRRFSLELFQRGAFTKDRFLKGSVRKHKFSKYRSKNLCYRGHDSQFLDSVRCFMDRRGPTVDLAKFDDKSLFVFYNVVFSKALVKFGLNDWGHFAKRMDKGARFKDLFFDGVGEESLRFLYGYSNEIIFKTSKVKGDIKSRFRNKQRTLENVSLEEVIENYVVRGGGTVKGSKTRSKVRAVIREKMDIVNKHKDKGDACKLLEVLVDNIDKIRVVREGSKEVVLEIDLFGSSNKGILEDMILKKLEVMGDSVIKESMNSLIMSRRVGELFAIYGEVSVGGVIGNVVSKKEDLPVRFVLTKDEEGRIRKLVDVSFIWTKNLSGVRASGSAGDLRRRW